MQKPFFKPVVQYDGNVGIRGSYANMRAVLYPIDHPNRESVSNTKQVITSPIVVYDERIGYLETENTVYVRRVVAK